MSPTPTFIMINLWPVLVAAIVAHVVGALWFSPALFGRAWMRLSNISEKQMQLTKKKGGMWKKYLASFISTLVMSFILAYLLNVIGVRTLGGAVLIAGTIWLGFQATTQIGMVLWDNKKVALYALITAHELVSLLVIAVVLAVWV